MFCGSLPIIDTEILGKGPKRHPTNPVLYDEQREE
jgi:hypothetical protein